MVLWKLQDCQFHHVLTNCMRSCGWHLCLKQYKEVFFVVSIGVVISASIPQHNAEAGARVLRQFLLLNLENS